MIFLGKSIQFLLNGIIIQNFEHWGVRYTSLAPLLLEAPGYFPKIYMLQV